MRVLPFAVLLLRRLSLAIVLVLVRALALVIVLVIFSLLILVCLLSLPLSFSANTVVKAGYHPDGSSWMDAGVS